MDIVKFTKFGTLEEAFDLFSVLLTKPEFSSFFGVLNSSKAKISAQEGLFSGFQLISLLIRISKALDRGIFNFLILLSSSFENSTASLSASKGFCKVVIS